MEDRSVPSGGYEPIEVNPAPAAPVAWQGTRATGTNTSNRYLGGEPSQSSPATYGENKLLHVNVDASYWDAQGGGLYLVIDIPEGEPPSDFDVFVYTSDAEGNKGGLVGQSHGPAGVTEHVFVGRASGYYLVQIYYFAVVDSYYEAEAGLVTRDLLPDTGQEPGLESSLPWNIGGTRPGPAVLYQPAPMAPQLENRDSLFKAAPLLVSGTEGYVNGEYLYQDYLYDDHGAETGNGGAGGDSPRVGDVTYPEDSDRYGYNAADLVEFRIASGDAEVAYRITLNTLLEVDSTIVAIAFDSDRDESTGSATLPLNPGASFPGTDEVIYTWGTGAAHYRWDGSNWQRIELTSVRYDLEANQITLIVPRSVSDPRGIWRTTVATGLYDPMTAATGGGWLLPIPYDPMNNLSAIDPTTFQTFATTTHPGGAGREQRNPSGIFNLAFRFNEPVIAEHVPPDTLQAVALRGNAPTRYARDIDFGKLDARVNSSNVPVTGPQVRLFPSRLDLSEGRARAFNEYPTFRSQLQPYFVYVPTTYRPGRPAGLTYLPIYAGNYYWAYNREPEFVRRLGEETGNIVLVPMGRGQNHMYRNEGEYDQFEAWNDVAAHFSLDPDKTTIAGISMGGYGTYRLGTLYPDLFAKAVTLIGPPGEGMWVPPAPPTGFVQGRDIAKGAAVDRAPEGAPETLTNWYLENARNLPYLNLAGTLDELVPFAGTKAQNLGAAEWGIKGFNDHGYQFHFRVLDAGGHILATGLRESYGLVQDWLQHNEVNRNPEHVTFAYVPAADEPSDGPGDPDLELRHNHAYWVSDLALADGTTPVFYGGSLYPAKGVIDAFSHAFGVAYREAPVVPTDGLVVKQDTADDIPVTDFSRVWDEPQPITPENRLDVKLTNLRAATVEVGRAALDPRADMTIVADTTAECRLTLAGHFPNVSVSGAKSERTQDGLVLILPPGQSVVTIRVNRIANGSFGDGDAAGTGPVGWTASTTAAGTATWNPASGSVSFAGNGGSTVLSGAPTWSSDLIAVTAGDTLELRALASSTGASSGATVSLVYRDAHGQEIDTASVLNVPLTTNGSVTLSELINVPIGAVSVQIVLTGFAAADLATAGEITFEEIGLFAT